LQIHQAQGAAPAPLQPGEGNRPDVAAAGAGGDDHVPLAKVAQSNGIERADVLVSFHKAGVGRVGTRPQVVNESEQRRHVAARCCWRGDAGPIRRRLLD
jgi:hypothetical protein